MSTKPMQGVLEVEMSPKVEPPAESSFLAVIERVATNPNVTVDVIERVLAIQERVEAKTAQSAFNAAMSEAQAEMRPVHADATNPQTRSRYASYEALDRALRPVYTKHGFGLSFDTGDAPSQEWVRVLCYVTHKGGHDRTYKADMPADGKGAKGGDVMTKTHAVGSAMSYGMRYLLKMIFNVAVGEDDDDGNTAGGKVEPEAPKGFDAFLTKLKETAKAGSREFYAFWNGADEECRRHLTRNRPIEWQALKAEAAKGKS